MISISEDLYMSISPCFRTVDVGATASQAANRRDAKLESSGQANSMDVKLENIDVSYGTKSTFIFMKIIINITELFQRITKKRRLDFELRQEVRLGGQERYRQDHFAQDDFQVRFYAPCLIYLVDVISTKFASGRGSGGNDCKLLNVSHIPISPKSN